MNSKIHNYLREYLEPFSKVLLLGFGREGQSTYRLLREIFPDKKLWIADANTSIPTQFAQKFEDDNVSFVTGDNYLDDLSSYDIIFKSPGISFQHINYQAFEDKITSQSQLFLAQYKKQIIGVTGTKGKSTTVRMIESVLKTHFTNVALVGNIGKPVFDILTEIHEDSKIVYELSSHQLEFAKHSPKIAILLNVFQEHLDYYLSYIHYQEAKFNIFKYQKKGDIAICFRGNQVLDNKIENYLGLQEKILFSKDEITDNIPSAYLDDEVIRLKGFDEEFSLQPKKYKNLVGKHNWLNAMVAIIVGKYLGVPNDKIAQGIAKFQNLPHRLEYVGKFRGIDFYNDSIATIPEACMSALDSFINVSTLIVGGKNRGIDYTAFIDFLTNYQNIDYLICLDKTGKLIYDSLSQEQLPYKIFMASSMEEVVKLAYAYTQKNKTCLLSPAASSFGMFKNFEERGELFKHYINVFEK